MAKKRKLDIDGLLPSWVLTLKAERKSPGTIKTYTAGVRRFLSWCEQTGTEPVLDKSTVTAYIAASLETCEATTAGGRLLALKRFSAWAAEEDEQPEDRLAGLRQPKLDSKTLTAFCKMWASHGHNKYDGDTLTFHVLFDGGSSDDQSANRDELLRIIEALGLELVDTPKNAAEGSVWVRADPRVDLELEKWS